MMSSTSSPRSALTVLRQMLASRSFEQRAQLVDQLSIYQPEQVDALLLQLLYLYVSWLDQYDKREANNDDMNTVDSSSLLYDFFCEKSSLCCQFALKLGWLSESICASLSHHTEHNDLVTALQQLSAACEIAMVNGTYKRTNLSITASPTINQRNNRNATNYHNNTNMHVSMPSSTSSSVSSSPSPSSSPHPSPSTSAATSARKTPQTRNGLSLSSSSSSLRSLSPISSTASNNVPNVRVIMNVLPSGAVKLKLTTTTINKTRNEVRPPASMDSLSFSSSSVPSIASNDNSLPVLDEDECSLLLSKQARSDFADRMQEFITNLTHIAADMANHQKQHRNNVLRTHIDKIHDTSRGCFFPPQPAVTYLSHVHQPPSMKSPTSSYIASNISCGVGTRHYYIARICTNDCFALSSKSHVPFMLFAEVLYTGHSVYDTGSIAKMKEINLQTDGERQPSSSATNAYLQMLEQQQPQPMPAAIQLQSSYLPQRQSGCPPLSSSNLTMIAGRPPLQRPRSRSAQHAGPNVKTGAAPVRVAQSRQRRNTQQHQHIDTSKTTEQALTHSHGVEQQRAYSSHHHNSARRATAPHSVGGTSPSLRHSSSVDTLASSAGGQQQTSLSTTTQQVEFINKTFGESMIDKMKRIRKYSAFKHLEDQQPLAHQEQRNTINNSNNSTLEGVSQGNHNKNTPSKKDGVSGNHEESKHQHEHQVRWGLVSVIFKSGDDLRAELLATQLLSICQDIFHAEGLSLFLRPYSVCICGPDTGLIETIPDCASIDQIKKTHPALSLREIFLALFSSPSSPSSRSPPSSSSNSSVSYQQALLNYIQSLAAYSLFTYIFNVKDRHNGNILLSRAGHIIHIDFGFLFASSPGGNWNWESSPFKLTNEYLSIISPSLSTNVDLFHLFESLFISGFLALRRHISVLCTVIEPLSYSYLSCFLHATDTNVIIQQLGQRFLLEYNIDQCRLELKNLIATSINHRRSTQYDYFQYYSSGIL